MSNRLQHKLYNYEASPPGKLWDKIAAALDESHLSASFPTKLYNLETNPPPGVWENIDSALSVPGETVIPKRNRTIHFLRYAAAAVLIGIIAFTVTWFINTDTKKGQSDQQATPVVVAAPDTVLKDEVADKTHNEAEALADASRDDAALEASKKTFARLDLPVKTRMMAINPMYLSEPVENRRMAGHMNPGEIYRDIYYHNIPVSIPFNQDPYDVTDRYIMLMTPDGNIIRMAKKWGELLFCVAGEEQDEHCTDQLKKWREKIASAPVAPSPGNFLDILSLLQSLKENHP
jgi:hypothetical protein